MGDIVRSESSLPQELLHKHFNEAVAAQNKAFEEALVSPLTIALGDEFQAIVANSQKAFEIARELRFRLLEHSIDCRFVIGMVEIRTPINDQNAWNMMGPGLGRARAKLNEKKAEIFYQFSFKEHPTMEGLLDGLATGLSVIEKHWTKRQRTDILALLGGKSAAKVARLRNVTVHNIYKIKSAGNFEPYLIQRHAISSALTEIDKKEGLS